MGFFYATWPFAVLELNGKRGCIRLRWSLIQTLFGPLFTPFEFDTRSVSATKLRGGVRITRPDGRSIDFGTLDADQVLAAVAGDPWPPPPTSGQPPYLPPPPDWQSPGGEAEAGDPVSWLQIESGWSVVGSDGETVGSVVSVAGDKNKDIFDGLAVDIGGSAGPRYVPGERVGLIFPGKVTVRFVGSEKEQLDEFEAPRGETVWRPTTPSKGSRLSNWMRRRR